jgi:hypothetical protein
MILQVLNVVFLEVFLAHRVTMVGMWMELQPVAPLNVTVMLVPEARYNGDDAADDRQLRHIGLNTRPKLITPTNQWMPDPVVEEKRHQDHVEHFVYYSLTVVGRSGSVSITTGVRT